MKAEPISFCIFEIIFGVVRHHTEQLQRKRLAVKSAGKFKKLRDAIGIVAAGGADIADPRTIALGQANDQLEHLRPVPFWYEY